MRRRDHVKKEENVSYWQSYSDMMAALLLIFVLVIAVAIVALNDYKEKLAEQNDFVQFYTVISFAGIVHSISPLLSK